MILDRIDINTLETKESLLPWQEQGRMYTASGYGRKIPTTRMVKLPGDHRWRRVYCCIYSNVGTCYVLKGKDWIVIYWRPPDWQTHINLILWDYPGEMCQMETKEQAETVDKIIEYQYVVPAKEETKRTGMRLIFKGIYGAIGIGLVWIMFDFMINMLNFSIWQSGFRCSGEIIPIKVNFDRV